MNGTKKLLNKNLILNELKKGGSLVCNFTEGKASLFDANHVELGVVRIDTFHRLIENDNEIKLAGTSGCEQNFIGVYQMTGA